MEHIRFDFSDFHRHGRAFYEFLELRKQVFVDQLKWDVPHNDAVEMDQYDTPVAHYSLVLRDGVVVGGARTMPTTATWGAHTYMLRDAHSGKLPYIPPHVMSVEITSPRVWECTRLVISSALTSQAERTECLRLIVDGLVDLVRGHGAEEMICLSSLHLMRALRQIGYDVTRLGNTYRNAEDGRQYGVLRMPAVVSQASRAAQSRIATGMPVVPKRRIPHDIMPPARQEPARARVMA